MDGFYAPFYKNLLFFFLLYYMLDFFSLFIDSKINLTNNNAMSNIIKEILDDINLQPNKSTLILKWVTRISLGLIGGAFILGQLKVSHLNRLGSFEKTLNENTQSLIELREDMNNKFDALNARIDKIYVDGYNAFNDFQELNKKQLELIIDYNKSDKEMLKRMLDITTMENNKYVENQLQTSKVESNKIYEMPKQKEYKTMITIVPKETKDTIYNVIGATKDFLDKIDKNKYIIEEIAKNKDYHELYDIKYKIK